MSQAAIEQILGRLMTDAGFRKMFFTGPIESLRHLYALTDGEFAALARSRTTLHQEQFACEEAALDDAICRAALKVEHN